MTEPDLAAGTDPVEVPVDGTLDLHTFSPKEVKDLLGVYLSECSRLGIMNVRIIHGKGTGALRETVHSVLRKNPLVLSFQTAGEGGGGWGATLAVLHTEQND